MNENNTKTAAARLRELYPNYSLTTAIDLLIDRVERAEVNIKKYQNEAISAKEKAYDFDKRYCDLLVENRKLKNTLNKINERLVRFVDTNEPETKKLEELEKMKQTVKCLIFVVLCFVGALIYTRFHKGIQFIEAYTLAVALLALFRTCKEEEK